MKYEVYEPTPEAEKPEPVTYFALKPSSNGLGVILYAVDDRGNAVRSGNILTISSKGVSLFPGVTPTVGLPYGDGPSHRVVLVPPHSPL